MPNDARQIAEAIKNQIEHDYDRVVIDNHLIVIIESIIAPHLLDSEKLVEWLATTLPPKLHQTVRTPMNTYSGNNAVLANIERWRLKEHLTAAIRKYKEAEADDE